MTSCVGSLPPFHSYLSSGEFVVVAGANRKASLHTRDGIHLSTITEQAGWIWSVATRPGQNYVALGCNDGTVGIYHLLFHTIHNMYKDRYAFRKEMTDVVVQNLTTEEECRIRCKSLVNRISIYKDRLAVSMRGSRAGRAVDGDCLCGVRAYLWVFAHGGGNAQFLSIPAGSTPRRREYLRAL